MFLDLPLHHVYRRAPIHREVVDHVRRDNNQCQACGKILRDDEIEFDHIIPVARGGSSEEWNLRVTCFDCNRTKSAKHKPQPSGLPVNLAAVSEEEESVRACSMLRPSPTSPLLASSAELAAITAAAAGHPWVLLAGSRGAPA